MAPYLSATVVLHQLLCVMWCYYSTVATAICIASAVILHHNNMHGFMVWDGIGE